MLVKLAQAQEISQKQPTNYRILVAVQIVQRANEGDSIERRHRDILPSDELLACPWFTTC